MTGLSTGCLAGHYARGRYRDALAALLDKIGKRPLRDLTAGRRRSEVARGNPLQPVLADCS